MLDIESQPGTAARVESRLVETQNLPNHRRPPEVPAPMQLPVTGESMASSGSSPGPRPPLPG